MVRYILAVIAGLVVGSVVNMAIVLLSFLLYPPPEGALADPEKIAAFTKTLPPFAFVLAWLAHAAGALAGGLVAAWIAKKNELTMGSIVGVLFLIAGIINAQSIDAPLWFSIVDFILYIPAGILGASLAKRWFLSAKPLS